jgi:hypothetical protein
VLVHVRLVTFKLEIIHRIMARHQQMKEAFEALAMLEQRILCKFLPASFDDVPLPNDNEMNVEDGDIQSKQRKVQDLKRSMLNRLVQSHEQQLLVHEDQSGKEWSLLEKICSHHDIVAGVTLLDFFKSYMANRTKQLKRAMRFKMILFRSKLIRHRRRLRSTQCTVGIWPQVLTDMSALPLTEAQLSYISSAGKRIIDVCS